LLINILYNCGTEVDVKEYLIAIKQHRSECLEDFNKLAELQKISLEELRNWRKIIGMRNALVHDYLTIDSGLLQQVLAERHYQFLTDFLKKACQDLQND